MLRNLSVAKKLLLLIVALVVPFSATTGLWLSNVASREIRDTEVALIGLREVRALRPLLTNLQDQRGNMLAYWAGDETMKHRINATHDKMLSDIALAQAVDLPEGLELLTSHRLEAIKQHLATLKLHDTMSTDQVFAKYSVPINMLINTIEDIGSYALINQTTNPEQYMFAGLATSKLPLLLESLYSIKGFARLAIQNGSFTDKEETIVNSYVTQAEVQLQRINHKLEELSAQLPHLADSTLFSTYRESARLVQLFLQNTGPEILSGAIPPSDFVKRASEAISAVSIDKQIEDKLEDQLLSDLKATKARFAAMVFATLVGFVISLIIAAVIIKDITRKLANAVDVADQVAGGKRKITIQTSDRNEFGALFRALGRMLDSIKNAENDLRAANEDLTKHNRIRQGQVEIMEAVRDQATVSRLSQKILDLLVGHTESSIGALYLRDDERLVRVASVASIADGKDVVMSGDGTAGRAAQTKQLLVIDNLPDGGLVLETLAGPLSIRSIVALPLVIADRVIGVTELGNVTRNYQACELEYLCSLSETLGASLSSAISREKADELYEEASQQAELLRRQKDELTAINAALEQRSMELQEQQAELEHSNSELEEQRGLLEAQKQELKEVNKALQASQRALEEKAYKLEEAGKYKSQFLANMSHELRTPLNSILILSKLLSENASGRLTKDEVESAATIHNSGTNLLELINDILDIAKVEAGKLNITPSEIELNVLLQELERAFKPQMIEKGLTFHTIFDSSCPATIVSDSMRIQQILRNLIDNAIKFTHAGSVTLKAYGLDDDHRTCPGGIAISVSDTGIGISQEHLERVFEPFCQVDGETTRKFGGTGLGLSIARSLAQRLGGQILIDSQKGRGSCLTLNLPLDLDTIAEGKELDEVPATSPARDAMGRLPHGKQLAELQSPRKPAMVAAAVHTSVDKTATLTRAVTTFDDDRDDLTDEDHMVLVVEDDPKFSEILLQHCRSRGFKCVVVPDGETGLNLARKYRPHAILLDHHLPGMSGIGVLDQLKSDPVTRHIPVHMISMEDFSSEAKKTKALGFLLKPVSTQQLDQAFSALSSVQTCRDKIVMLIEDNEAERLALKKLLALRGVTIVEFDAVAPALEYMTRGERPHCIILDLNLKDRSGAEFLRQLEARESNPPPVIVYTGKELERKELERLEEQAGSIIIKGARSHERLLDEVTLFFHHVEETLPESQREMLERVRNRVDEFDYKRVLIVDDDMRNVFSLRRALHLKGFHTEVAKNGLEALERLRSHPGLDLVLMDVMMPEMDGLQTTRAIRAMPLGQRLPVIALTAKAMKGDRDKCIEAGANAYLPKPVDVDHLVSLMRVWLNL